MNDDGLRIDGGHDPAFGRRASPRSAGGGASTLRTWNFESVLFPRGGEPAEQESQSASDAYRDLNLDQVVAAITSGWDEFELDSFFRIPLTDSDSIAYRQEVMRDLEDPELARAIEAFTRRIGDARRYLNLSEELYYKQHKEGWFLASAERYCKAVHHLSQDLGEASLKSRGLRSFREYVAAHVGSEGFGTLRAEAARLSQDLSGIRYALIIKGNRVTVRQYDGEIDYGAVVEQAFEKFRQGAVKDYRRRFKGSGMNHVEAQVLERVARLYPDVFEALEAFRAERSGYPDEIVMRFYREIQFYMAYLDYLRPLRRAGLSFCYPRVSKDTKEVTARDAFDMALAQKLVREGSAIVPNDILLRGPERILVVSGPNQGGKTTFARMFGQLHYLASLGCPVPGTQAQLFLFDRLLTHFEREEDIATLRGKLEDDLVRIHRVLDRATSNSLLITNELFASTTLRDAVGLSKKVLERVSQLDLLCVCVTFLDELASLNEKTVSVMSTVNPDNPAERTYRLERRPADGLAYALAIARKHRLTYEQLTRRIQT